MNSKSHKETKTKYLQIRVTEKQHQEITKVAQSMNKKISEIVVEYLDELTKQNAKK